MDTNQFIQKRVKEYYWHDDINCATTNIKVLAEFFDIELSSQVIDAALGMHGAGAYGAQCGLVEGALMLIGILGRKLNIHDDEIANFCNDFAGQFENRFGSLLCSILRPEGFSPGNPPHLCEKLTCDAISFNIDVINRFFIKYKV